MGRMWQRLRNRGLGGGLGVLFHAHAIHIFLMKSRGKMFLLYQSLSGKYCKSLLQTGPLQGWSRAALPSQFERQVVTVSGKAIRKPLKRQNNNNMPVV